MTVRDSTKITDLFIEITSSALSTSLMYSTASALMFPNINHLLRVLSLLEFLSDGQQNILKGNLSSLLYQFHWHASIVPGNHIWIWFHQRALSNESSISQSFQAKINLSISLTTSGDLIKHCNVTYIELLTAYK